jgi:DNA-binding NarL/FixJ family response regulator
MAELLIVDDHPIMRQGLVQFLQSMPDVRNIREASTGAEALREFRASRPDAVILDLTLGKESGLDVLRQMHAEDPKIPVMILTMHDESLHAERALAAGARGYVMKHEATDTVIDAVRRLLDGELVFSRTLQEKVLLGYSKRNGPRHPSGVSALTAREIEILSLIGAGLSSAQIASRLSRSVKTIETHRASLRGKLGLDSTFELVRYAMNWVAR